MPRESPFVSFGENVDEGMHICTFFHTSDERYRVLMPFIREGMEQGDRALHIVNPSVRNEHAQRIAEAGIDASRAEGGVDWKSSDGTRRRSAAAVSIRALCSICCP